MLGRWHRIVASLWFRFLCFCVGRHIFQSIWRKAHFNFPNWALIGINKKLNNLAKESQSSHIWNKCQPPSLWFYFCYSEKLNCSLISKKQHACYFHLLTHTNNCDEKETQRTDKNMFPPSQQHHIEEPKQLGRLRCFRKHMALKVGCWSTMKGGKNKTKHFITWTRWSRWGVQGQHRKSLKRE